MQKPFKKYFRNLVMVFLKDDFFFCFLTTNAKKKKGLGGLLYWQLGTFILDNVWN